MILDDDIDIGNLFKHEIQRKFNSEVFTFTDPVLALEDFRINSETYGLVISDIRMPIMNGYEFVEQIKNIKPDMKVLLMSAYEYEYSNLPNGFLQSDIDGFIEKPVSLYKLNEMILANI
ncbi:MAG TPA: response regulator [Nitrososphaeraceae archaeon]